ncbi:MAG: transcriptional regulator GcvA [Xanthomonadales bacterium]|nr:transcriptional regulator GcvA [Gammaproteobacteria bacterium]MBT8053754.1 transcriptional regulator GcvA [Gammaproteobacteria bacterium]NND57635.1 transcriptional regulator GcvA [Xanthomonadales bacterium]NNK51591.1 transcriptional regulator GcvA [Xanthomonadales bacterium]
MSYLPLNALRTFEAVASRLSFAGGAKALNVSPAAVSSQIRALEDRLGVALFRRHGRQVTLTPAGRKLLPGVQRGLSELRKALEEIRQDRSEGTLNVSMMPSFLQKWLMPRLVGFYSAHPDIDLRINVDNARVNFEQSDMHAAVRFGQGGWPGVKAVKLADDWILPVCSRRWLKKNGPIKSIRELQKRELMFLQSDMWDAWFRVTGESTRDSRWSMLNDSQSILMAAEQGEGIALSRWSLVARDLKAKRLVRPIDTIVKADWSYHFVAPPHYFDLPKVAAFRDWLLEHFSRFEPPE